jgi:hypothetical protein
MDFTDDELRMILDALSSLDIHGKLDEEEIAMLHSIRDKIKEHF